MNTTQRPAFGQQVTVKAGAVRRNDYEQRRTDDGKLYTQQRKVWKRREFHEPRTALFIGYRTKYDGEIEWIDEVGNVFTPETHFELWLVCEDPRRAPYFVYPGDCEWSEKPGVIEAMASAAND